MTLRKQRGNLPRVSRTVEKKFSESTASSRTSTLLKEPLIMIDQIPVIIVTNPEGQQTFSSLTPKEI